MSTVTEVQPTVRPRRRPSAKTSRNPGEDKVKSTIILSAHASRRLSIHATMLGEDRSALVERLVNDHLRQFVVQDRGKVDVQVHGEV